VALRSDQEHAVSRTATFPASRLVAAAAVMVVALGGLLLAAERADSQPALPEVPADELLASVVDAVRAEPTVSGELSASLDLGLPDLPVEGLETEGGLAALAGDRRLRVASSPDGFRVADLRETAERVFVTDFATAWTWNSDTLEATRYSAGERQASAEILPFGAEPDAPLSALPFTSDGLAALDDSTEVRVVRTAETAGRAVYRLVLDPRTDETLVDRVELDVDAVQRLPLRLAVFSRGAAEPAAEVAWTSVSFDPIDPATFTFTPPPGATVTEGGHEPGGPGPGHGSGHGRGHGRGLPDSAVPPPSAGAGEPIVLGDGAWATVVAIPTDGPIEMPDGEATDGPALPADLLPYSGPLLSAREAEVDGQTYLLVGAVPQSSLEAAVAELP